MKGMYLPYLSCLSLSIAVWAIGCDNDEKKNSGQGEGCDMEAPDCGEGMVCETTRDGAPQCVYPIIIRGVVLGASDGAPIEGSTVQAVDPNAAATGTSDISDSDGTFSLTVPATRDAEGKPVDGAYTLRAQARGYEKFPSGIRQALPLDASSAVREGDVWVIESALSTIELLSLPGDPETRGTISGDITGDNCAGVLVVAESENSTVVGYSDADCHYTIFNVPAGDYNVNGYAVGLQVDGSEATVSEGENTAAVDLPASDAPLSTVSGNVQIVNAPGGLTTSVVLAVESTFLENLARGEVPPGLRAGEVDGNFAIEGVPDGRYVVLAAFENDQLVRDPDESIGGTQIVHIEVPDPDSGNAISLAEGFKVTEALAIVQPGAVGPEAVSSQTPMLEWDDDSSEDGYTIVVYDAFGEEIWADEIEGVSGSATVTHAYAGPELVPGMYYQFRVTSFRDTNDGRVSISITEDLRGVFYYTL